MWTEPKTNWSASDFCTAEDINRINGNIQYLLTHTNPSKTFTQSDIVTIAEWQNIRKNVVLLAQMLKIPYAMIDDRVTYDNFNNVETLMAKLKDPVDRRYNMVKANKYVGRYHTGYIYTGGR